jgi:hypothetical protein
LLDSHYPEGPMVTWEPYGPSTLEMASDCRGFLCSAGSVLVGLPTNFPSATERRGCLQPSPSRRPFGRKLSRRMPGSWSWMALYPTSMPMSSPSETGIGNAFLIYTGRGGGLKKLPPSVFESRRPLVPHQNSTDTNHVTPSCQH